MLSGAPFGYRYVRKSEHAEARYEIVATRRRSSPSCSPATPTMGSRSATWPAGWPRLGVAARTGKPRWDRSTVAQGMLRNPRLRRAGLFSKTMRTDQTAEPIPPRLAGRRRAPAARWSSIGPAAVARDTGAALVAEDTWQRVQQRLADNKRYATRNSINPSLLQGIAPAVAAATPTIARRHHHQQEDLLLPLPRLGRLPLRARPGLRQQAGAREYLDHRRPRGTTSPPCLPTRP